MNSTAKLLDVVALTVDLPQCDLWRGQVGTVVEILANGAAFEVEFSDRNGRTYESLGLQRFTMSSKIKTKAETRITSRKRER